MKVFWGTVLFYSVEGENCIITNCNELFKLQVYNMINLNSRHLGKTFTTSKGKGYFTL